MTYRDATGPDDPSTLYIQEAVNRYPERLIGYIRINPNAAGAIEALDQAIGDFKMKTGSPGSCRVRPEKPCADAPGGVSRSISTPGMRRWPCEEAEAAGVPAGKSDHGPYGRVLPLRSGSVGRQGAAELIRRYLRHPLPLDDP
jgi:hypothetical protein